ncbi:MAG: S-layer homology domain-containing protein [Syntrophomonadaceae bacterium]|nr:S-layer homology domain-containing protein [Syntrophomonadaceae bacterium]
MPFWPRILRIALGVLILAGMHGTISTKPLLAATFTDLSDHWAKPAVYRAAALDLIQGYPDGSFRPQQTVSQLEALVLFLRAGGFNLETTAANRTPPVTEPTPEVHMPPLPWGQNYLEIALEKQLLPAGQVKFFKPDTPATRAQVAVLLSRLLQLPTEIEPTLEKNADLNTTPFSDLNTASPTELAAIQAVARQGLLQGYPDGTFGPARTLTRGEAVMLLSRLLDQNWVHLPAKRCLDGWIKKYTPAPNTAAEMEIASLQGTQKVKIHPQAKCFFQGQEISLARMVDYRAEVLLNSSQQAICITLFEKRTLGAPKAKLRGTVKSIILGVDSLLVLNDLEGQDQILPLAWDAVLEMKKAASTKGFPALKPETFVEVYLSNDKVVKVTVLEWKKCSGTVENITSRRLYLASKGTSRKAPTWFNYYDRARLVDKEGKKITTILRGDKVQVLYLDPYPDEIDDEIPLEITVTNRPAWKTVKGTIQTIAGTEDNREIELGKNKLYRVDPWVKLYRKSNGRQEDFSILKTGDKVEINIDGAGVVMEIALLS